MLFQILCCDVNFLGSLRRRSLHVLFCRLGLLFELLCRPRGTVAGLLIGGTGLLFVALSSACDFVFPLLSCIRRLLNCAGGLLGNLLNRSRGGGGRLLGGRNQLLLALRGGVGGLVYDVLGGRTRLIHRVLSLKGGRIPFLLCFGCGSLRIRIHALRIGIQYLLRIGDRLLRALISVSKSACESGCSRTDGGLRFRAGLSNLVQRIIA